MQNVCVRAGFGGLAPLKLKRISLLVNIKPFLSGFWNVTPFRNGHIELKDIKLGHLIYGQILKSPISRTPVIGNIYCMTVVQILIHKEEIYMSTCTDQYMYIE